jgi:hypothetical protein
MIVGAASAFPWPGNQPKPRQRFYYQKHPSVLLLLANNLRFGDTRVSLCLKADGEIAAVEMATISPRCRAPWRFEI